MSDTYILLLAALVFALLLSYWQRTDAEFDLRWLLVDTVTGKVSLFKLGQFVALVVSTWVLVYETRRGMLTEWLFGFYMAAWAGANIANKFVERKLPEPPK